MFKDAELKYDIILQFVVNDRTLEFKPYLFECYNIEEEKYDFVHAYDDDSFDNE